MELDASQSAAVAELDERLNDEAEALSMLQQKAMHQLETHSQSESTELEQKIEMRCALLDQKVNVLRRPMISWSVFWSTGNSIAWPAHVAQLLTPSGATCIEHDMLSGRGSRLGPVTSVYQNVFLIYSYAHDEQGVNRGHVRGFDGVLYKLWLLLTPWLAASMC